MGFSNHPKKKTPRLSGKKTGPFLGFLSNGAVYSFFPPISGFTPGSAWRPGRHRNSLLRCGSVRRPPGKRSSPKKRGGSTARFWFSRFDEVMIFFVVFTFEKTMLDQYEMCIYLYHMYIYIYTWFIMIIHVQIESEKDSHCHGSLMLDQFLEMR